MQVILPYSGDRPTPESFPAIDAAVACAPGAKLLETALRVCPAAWLAQLLPEYFHPRLNYWCSGTDPPGPVRAPAKAAAVLAQVPAVTFLLTAAGSAKHFRPERDESQWWGRRDAHSRCAAAALWHGEGQAFGGVGACLILYEDGSMIHMDPQVVQQCPVPCEASLISRWRDAALEKEVPGIRRTRALAKGQTEQDLQVSRAGPFPPQFGQLDSATFWLRMWCTGTASFVVFWIFNFRASRVLQGIPGPFQNRQPETLTTDRLCCAGAMEFGGSIFWSSTRIRFFSVI